MPESMGFLLSDASRLLRKRFDERLEALKAPGAAARLLAAAKAPVKLRGKVKAGDSY